MEKIKKFNGSKAKNVELRKEKTKYNIGLSYSILYDGTPQALVSTCIGNHSDEEVIANANLYANAFDNLMMLKLIAVKLQAGESLDYKEIVKQINKSCV